MFRRVLIIAASTAALSSVVGISTMTAAHAAPVPGLCSVYAAAETRC